MIMVITQLQGGILITVRERDCNDNRNYTIPEKRNDNRNYILPTRIVITVRNQSVMIIAITPLQERIVGRWSEV
jgi:hypothetical protein